MNRRTFIRNSALTVGALTLSQRGLLASLFSPQGTLKMLRGNVGIFTEKGGTIGFYLGKDGIAVIDSQFPDSVGNFISDIKKQSELPFEYLINTHHHGDHTSGNIAFKGLIKNHIAHENCLKNLTASAEKAKTLDKQLLPATTFSKSHQVKMDKEEIEMKYFGPAHTDGDIIVYFDEANIAHMGDLMFNRRHPYVDRSAGANIQNWIKVLNKAAKKYEKDTLYIFGHAGEGYEVTGTRNDLFAFRDYLQRVLDFAEAEIKAGRSKEDFLKNTSIPGVTEWKGEGITRPLTAAYEEVSARKK
jgi:cyclase